MPYQTDLNRKASVQNQRSLFGRRQGRSLSGTRLEMLENLLPKLEITTETIIKQDSHKICPSSLFDDDFTQYELEIGFGHGERLAQYMVKKPHTGFIAAEPFITGVADFLQDIKDNKNNNIRILADDGMLIANVLNKNSLNKIYVLNPDPWHKKRHHKRRIINQDNLNTFAQILKPGGKLIMTTDVPSLAEWMCTQTTNNKSFRWKAQRQEDWVTPPKNWIKTRYEQKGAKGTKKMVYLIFEKITD